MGQCIRCNRPMTYVANGYDRDIQACVKVDKINVVEEDTIFGVDVGGAPVSAGVAHHNRQRRTFVNHDPGFVIIKPGCHLGFAASGADGNVFVTIQIGSHIPVANFQVQNNRNVILAKDGSPRNAMDNKIWIDTSRENHYLTTSADTEAISLTEKPIESHGPVDGSTRASSLTISRVEPATSRTVATEPARRYRNKGRVERYFGTKGNAVGQLNYPNGICATAADDIVVADCHNNRIQIFDANGSVKEVIGRKGTDEGQFDRVAGVCVTPRGRIVASDSENHRIQIFDEQGKFVRKFGSFGLGAGKLSIPCGVATDDKGLIYVCDCFNDRVQVFSEEGKFVREFGSESLNRPQYISVTSDGRAVVSDRSKANAKAKTKIRRVISNVTHRRKTSNGPRVHVFDSHDGRHLSEFGSHGRKKSQFDCPRGVATDDHGNIIVCDGRNHRVQVFTSCGEFVSCFGSEGSDPGQMNQPQGVCVLSDGGIAVTDNANHRVQIFYFDV